MEKEQAQELISKLDAIEKRLGKVADALSVFKVMAMAFLIAYLIVEVGPFLINS